MNGIAELYPNLKVLKLSGNHIKTMEELRPLAQCTKLENLDISNNPVSQKVGETTTTTTTEEATA